MTDEYAIARATPALHPDDVATGLRFFAINYRRECADMQCADEGIEEVERAAHVIEQQATELRRLCAASQLKTHQNAFWNKHGMPSMLPSSCFKCGHVGEPSTTHAELPNVYICKACVAAQGADNACDIKTGCEKTLWRTEQRLGHALAALRPFVAAYNKHADHIGDSDLDNEQDRAVYVTLGDCRNAARVLAAELEGSI